MSIIENGKRQPNKESCIVIAKALNTPPEELFRIAGILPPVQEQDRLEQKLDYLIKR